VTETSPGHVTRLLADLRGGRRAAFDELLPLVYAELKRLARSRLARERPGRTLQATGLVHEAYLRLVGDESMAWENRGHFFATAAEAMRRILIERARRRQSLKRGGGRTPQPLDEELLAAAPPDEELLALHEALERLEASDAQRGQVVKLRYFAGLSIEETAQALALSPRSVTRLWASARAWLHREIARGGAGLTPPQPPAARRAR
jgi:RNA polymerase sigma factor (TIGR02999 family)